MIRWRRIIGVSAALFAVHVPHADAATYGAARLLSCDMQAQQAVFEGQMRAYRRAPKMQLRFTLQAQTPESGRWRKVALDSFRTWITAPANLGKYTYDKTVQDLIAPASYRAVIDFRWRDRRGRTVRAERVTSPVCKQVDQRPDLVVRDVHRDGDQFVAEVFNRGRSAAGTFAVAFFADGAPVGTVDVAGLAPQTPVTVMTPATQGAGCAAGAAVEALADSRAQVDEGDEENNGGRQPCAGL
jgi:hypothetical protein